MARRRLRLRLPSQALQVTTFRPPPGQRQAHGLQAGVGLQHHVAAGTARLGVHVEHGTPQGRQRDPVRRIFEPGDGELGELFVSLVRLIFFPI